MLLDERRRRATWQLKASIPNGASGTGAYLSMAVSAALACAVSSSGTVATSTDGGATWIDEGVVDGAVDAQRAVRERR